jgi:hypothetical protein
MPKITLKQTDVEANELPNFLRYIEAHFFLEKVEYIQQPRTLMDFLLWQPTRYTVHVTLSTPNELN